MSRVFISSTIHDLMEERKAVYLALRRLGHASVALEDWAASPATAVDQNIHELQRSDIVICIIGWQYGFVPEGYDKSIVELVLDAALEFGIPLVVFFPKVGSISDFKARKLIDANPDRVMALRDRLSRDRVVNCFSTAKELAWMVAAALHEWIAQGRSAAPRVPDAVAPSTPPIGPEVFLSYAHEDVGTAEQIAARFSEERWSVFWDRKIPVGATWDEIVEAALDSAKCVVVLWSSSSSKSAWVRAEANEGAERCILAPALIEDTKIPLRFRPIEAANLIGWSRSSGDTPDMKSLLGAVHRFVGDAA